ncbi:MAG TPA: hypothetical protein VGH91_05125 [Gammaproteobacteria bacterium]|jgi:hypothetical protein
MAFIAPTAVIILCPRCHEKLDLYGLVNRSSFVPQRGTAVCRHCGAHIRFSNWAFRLLVAASGGMAISALGMAVMSLPAFAPMQMTPFLAVVSVMLVSVLALAAAAFGGLEEVPRTG